MDSIINEINKSFDVIDGSKEVVNKIVVKHPIINPVQSFCEISENKHIDVTNLSENSSVVDTVIKVT